MSRFRPHRRQSWGRPLCLIGLVLGLSALLVGCGRGSFFGRQYDDFTAYYNTFHNAQKAFEKGLKSVNQSAGTDVDRTRYISLFPDIQTQSGESSFKKAIQKSADVLREHPNSKWVDDALLLIGRSRYYLQNYVGAVQKFREVIALGGDRVGEARFRLAQTLVAADRYSEAAEALRVGLEQEADHGPWTARMRLVQGQLFVRQEKWGGAEGALAEGLKGSLPDEVGARGALLLGQVRETLEDYDGAQEAYRQAAEDSPTYPLEFAARLGAIEMQGRNGDPEGALDRLEALERGDDTNEMRGKIARVRARLYRELGRPGKAKQVLANVLRGDEAPRGAVAGRIHYDLATLYRDRYEDFTRAAAHFDTAATSLSSGGRQRESGTDGRARMLPRTPSDAALQAERFQGVADRSAAVARLDSLLRLGRMPPSEFRAVVQRLRKERLEEQEQEARARRRQQQQFRPGVQAGRRRDEAGASQQNAVQTRGSDAGFLFHRDPTLVQQGRRQFKQTWGDRPLVDNWRRVNAIQGVSASAPAEEGGRQREGPSRGQGRSESVLDLSAVPRDSASQATMERKRAAARYELAKALFRAAGRPDSAETWFRRVLTETEDHPVARKALYGLAQAHRAQGDSAAAEDAYRQVIERYPGTPYATRAREQLGLKRAQPVSNSQASKADSAYARGYELWQNGTLDPALDTFLSLAKTYPETPAAPRALLAAGVVYHRSARHDTTGRFGRQFERFVDSLVQAPSEPQPGTSADTTGEFSSTPPQGRSPSDTTNVQTVSRRAADTTAAPDTPQRAPRQVTSVPDSAEAPPDSTGRTVLDSASREQARKQGPPRRRVDSTAVADRSRRTRRPDSTESDSSVSPPDTTARPVQRAGSDRADAPPNAPSDSVRADSVEHKGQREPLKILLTHLTERYAGTPEAKRAEKLLAYLKQKRADADSTAPDPSASGTPSEPTPAPDSMTVSTAPDSATAAGDGPQTPARSPDTTARPQRHSPDTTHSDEGAPRPTRTPDSTAKPDPDSTAPPSRDSTTVPKRTDSPASPDPSGE